MVDLVQLTKRFGHVTAVNELSLSVRTGEFLTLLGPSGCGKTTTLRMVAGFEQPTSGEIVIDGERMGDRPPYLRPVNTVFQQYALFPHLTVFDNVAFGLNVTKVPAEESRRRVTEALGMLDLVGLEDRKPREISGGQQQRVALARALVCRPKVLLLDEPLGALDLKLRQQIQLEIKELQRELGITFIYVTHDQDEALALSDRIVVMRHGQIEQIGSPQQVYATPATRFVATFIGETNLLEGTVQNTSGAQSVLDWQGHKVIGRKPVNELPPGSRGVMVIRPEDVLLEQVDHGKDQLNDGESKPGGVISEQKGSREDALTGRVIEEVYGGSHVRIVVQLRDGQRLLVRTGREKADLYPVGVTVRVSWPEGTPILVGCD